MRVYVIEYKTGLDKKLSQEGYSTLKGAQEYIEKKTNIKRKETEFRYIDESGNEYLIHDVLVK